ncbi:TonB-dependent receptor [Kordiimonas marina]|uniref:TonB-dependent receptor n=1 Tax=Kordiimonas marina TaxID=2872312 RepID=UPI001FF45B5D|nr:TonB-dependent receptor [Kordiimonas marina]MCJ9428808.1 TonB-dependent receptor [Kordiimonas marina]
MESKRKLYRSRLMSSAATGMALVLLAAGSVHAQDAAAKASDKAAATAKASKKKTQDVNTLEEITVTGLRASIESSLQKKKDNTSMVEAITAEDIGKLPDTSIAESIARLPGLAAQRLDGRANVVSIRGLGPDFTTTLLNGREQVSASDNRSVELDQYPAELMSGVVVYKTPDAGLVGQGLGGTIDMQTVRPLSYGRRRVVVGLRGELNTLGKLNPDVSNKGYRANFTYIDQFADDTIGVAIGYSKMKEPTQENRWQAWGYPTAADGNLVLGGAKPYVKSNTLDRDGLIGVLEYKPDASLHTRLDLYYSKFKDHQRLRGIELPLAWSAAQLQPGYTVDNGLITNGTFDGVEAVMRNDVVHRDSSIFAAGWNVDYQVNDKWSVNADLSYSRLKKFESNIEIYAGTGRGGGVGATDNLGFTLNSNGVAQFDPTIDYADPTLFKLTDSQGWNNCGGRLANCQDGFINHPKIHDELYAIRLAANRQFEKGLFSSVDFGVYFSHREKSLLDQGDVLTLKDYPTDVQVPSQYMYDPVSLGFIGIPGMVSFDSYSFFQDGNYTRTRESLWNTGRLTNTWTVTEKVITPFVKANIDGTWGNTPVKGNIGVQAVHTDQSSLGNRVTTNDNGQTVVTPGTFGDKYWEILPSLNMSFEVSENHFIRVGLSRTLARARLDQENSGLGYSVHKSVNGESPWSGSGGNPNLRPYLADSADLAYEAYFGNGGAVSVAAYYKHLETWVTDLPILTDFSGLPTNGIDVNNVYQGFITVPVNTGGGNLWGAELATTLPGTLLSEKLDGFGNQFSLSYTNSKVKIDPVNTATMPGLSHWVLNDTLYYEKNGFQARVSGRYRTAFLAEVAALSLSRTLVEARSEFLVDAQIGYEFQSGPFDGLSILLQGKNLTNRPFITYLNNDIRQVRDYQEYGRNIMLGVTYDF